MEQKKKGIELLRNVENAFLFGVRYNDTSGTRRTTGGLTYFISSYTSNIGGSLTYTTLEGELRTVFRYGADRKFMLASPLVMSAMSLLVHKNGSLRVVPKENTYGIAISQWLSPHGTVMLVKDNQLQGTTYGGYAFLLELEELAYRYMQGRDVTLSTNVQNPADDFYLDVYDCEVGLEIHNEPKHRLLYGITGAATG